MIEPVNGRCFCGDVRFQFSEAPIALRACWCRDCQYLAAGNASVNAIFRTASLSLSGEVAEYVSEQRQHHAPPLLPQMRTQIDDPREHNGEHIDRQPEQAAPGHELRQQGRCAYQ